MKGSWAVVSLVDGEFNYGVVCPTYASAKKEFSKWIKEHDDHPDGPTIDNKRLAQLVKARYYDDQSGYVVQIVEDSIIVKSV